MFHYYTTQLEQWRSVDFIALQTLCSQSRKIPIGKNTDRNVGLHRLCGITNPMFTKSSNTTDIVVVQTLCSQSRKMRIGGGVYTDFAVLKTVCAEIYLMYARKLQPELNFV